MKSVNTWTRHQRIWGTVALAGLFLCGLMVGIGFSTTKYVEKKVESVQRVVEKLPEKTCSAIEKLLTQRLMDENTQECWDLVNNVSVYKQMIEKGCPENKENYNTLMQRNVELATAVCDSQELYMRMGGLFNSFDNTTCEKIENEMLPNVCQNCLGAEHHIDNAKIYAILAERGCSENSQKYVDLAKQELEIARALEDDKFTQSETIEVVETYKRINMQKAAEEIFDKAKKLTNPAIDFIMEVEKIINE